MQGKIFFDTNILVYSKLKKQSSGKWEKTQTLIKNEENEVIISTQVLNEFYSVLAKNKISHKTICDCIEEMLLDVELHNLTLATIKKAWDIHERYQFSYYDCLILASALETGCSMIYSEDFSHGQVVDNKLLIQNPFLAEGLNR